MLFLDIVAESYINMFSFKQHPTFSILLIELSNQATVVLKHQALHSVVNRDFSNTPPSAHLDFTMSQRGENLRAYLELAKCYSQQFS